MQMGLRLVPLLLLSAQCQSSGATPRVPPPLPPPLNPPLQAMIKVDWELMAPLPVGVEDNDGGWVDDSTVITGFGLSKKSYPGCVSTAYSLNTSDARATWQVRLSHTHKISLSTHAINTPRSLSLSVFHSILPFFSPFLPQASSPLSRVLGGERTAEHTARRGVSH